MVIDYENVTLEYIEEYIEFIDLSKFSKEFFDNNIKNKFKKVPQVDSRIWIEDFLFEKLKKPKEYEKLISAIYYIDLYNKRVLLEIDYNGKICYLSKDVFKKIEKTIPVKIEAESYIRRLIKINFPDEDLDLRIIGFDRLPLISRENSETFIFEELLRIIYTTIRCTF